MGRGAWIAPAQRLLGEGRPHRAGEIAAEGSQSHHCVLRPVHPAGKGGHEGHRHHDSHDLPGPEAPAAGAGGVHGAGDGVPEQQEAGQHQHAAVEDEQHVAEDGVAGDVDIAQEPQEVSRRAVPGGEDVGVDGLRLCRLRAEAHRAHCHEAGTQGREACAQEGAWPPPPFQQAAPAPASASRRGALRCHRGVPVGECAHVLSEPPDGLRDLAETAADLGREKEAQETYAHRGAAPGSVRPGSRRISSVASARRAASMAPRRSSRRSAPVQHQIDDWRVTSARLSPTSCSPRSVPAS